MGLFKRLKEPIVLKESNHLKEEYEYVKKLVETCDNPKLNLKLKQLEYGIKGEEKIIYELKNSHIPMYILHDINLEYLGFKCQIDYIVVTRNFVYVIESKNLYGNIKIDYKGNFVRSYNINDKEYIEGIYSPIEQNEKHLDLLKFIGYENKKMIDKIIFDKLFYKYYKSLIVLSNPKTILDDKDASYDIKDKIVKVDRLISYIKEDNKSSNNNFSDKEMFNIANSILLKHQEPFIYYDILYKDYINNKDGLNNKELNNSINYDLKLEKELKKYRYYISNKDNIIPYMVFSNKELKLLVENKPKNKDELLKISGFGARKVEKYGKKIIEIIKKYL